MFQPECRPFPGVQTIHQGPGLWTEDKNAKGKQLRETKRVCPKCHQISE